MKLRKKTKMPVLKKNAEEDVETVDSEGAEAMLQVQAELNTLYVARYTAIKGLVYALICGHHIMLEGEPGIAKSSLAEALAERVVGDDFCCFKTQLTKGMVSDALFGPMRIQKLREFEVYEFNTKGMLPNAHIAILDEIYRGPEMLLPSLLNVLNERTFANGQEGILQCPLITAVGTTNFQIDTDELKAFHDRWLINLTIKPLTSTEERLTMLKHSLIGKPTMEHTISLSQLLDLARLRTEVKVPPIILEIYEALTQKLLMKSRRAGGVSGLRNGLSDRRIVWSLRLAQAAAVLRKADTLIPDDLVACQMGLITMGVPEEESWFTDAMDSEVGTYKKRVEEAEEISKLEKLVDKYTSLYGENLPKERLKRLQAVLREVISTMTNQNFSEQVNIQRSRRYAKSFEDLLNQVSSDLDAV